jgi:hypothetical protein
VIAIDVQHRRWLGIASVLTFIVLTFALTLCAFGGDHDTTVVAHHGTAGSSHGSSAETSHGMSPDLCLGLLLAPATVLLLAGLVPGQWLLLQAPAVPCLVAPARLDHPPRILS